MLYCELQFEFCTFYVYLLKDLKTLFIQFMHLVCRLHLNLAIMPVFEMIVMSEKNERSLVSRHSLTKSHL